MIPVSFSLFLYFSFCCCCCCCFMLLFIFTNFFFFFLKVILFFHVPGYSVMFRNVPECSGMFLVLSTPLFNSIPKSVLLGGFSLGDRQLYLLHAFTPIGCSGLKPTILFEYHGFRLCSSKTKQSIGNKGISCTTRRCGGGLNAR